MRVDELARELGVTSDELLRVLADLTDEPPDSAESDVTDDLAGRARGLLASRTETAIDADVRQAGEDLIRRAFDTARLAGKSRWDRMSIAVLKNRMLDLTNKTFDESAFGVSSFREWLALFDNVLELDTSRQPPWVRLIDAKGLAEPGVATSPRQLTLPPRWRIRSDLWRAVTDLGAAGDWYWDGDGAFFHPDALDDPTLAHEIPTLTSDDMRALRAGFAARLPERDRSSETIERWVSELLPDSVLPSYLRGQWIAALKQGVLRRLRTWFEEHGLPMPVDLVEESSRGPREDSVAELRSLVMECVKVMTRSELEDLRLPPAAIVRATRR